MSTYNLDSEKEYFEFSIFGGLYHFRLPTFEEGETFDAIDRNDEKLPAKEVTKKRLEYLASFITKANEKALDFQELTKKMTAAHWKKFNEMVKTEMS